METSTNISIEELNTSIVLLPQQLTCDDISDLFSLSQYYAVRTPQSFRKVICLYYHMRSYCV